MASATGLAGGHGVGAGLFFAEAHQAIATNNHPFDWFPSVGMLNQGGVLHALHQFKAAGGLTLPLVDGFINIGGHGRVEAQKR